MDFRQKFPDEKVYQKYYTLIMLENETIHIPTLGAEDTMQNARVKQNPGRGSKVARPGRTGAEVRVGVAGMGSQGPRL